MMLEDIAQRAHDQILRNGGITVSMQGEEPSQGYAFSPFPELERVLPAEQVTPEVVLQYLHDNTLALTMPGNYLGAWHDQQSGNVFLDVSHVGPPTADTVAEAAKANQIAVMDLSNYHEIPTGVDRSRDVTSAVDHQAVLDANAGRDLQGLPGHVNVPNHGPLQFHAHGDIQRLAEEYNRANGLGAHPTDYSQVDPATSAKIAQEYERMPHNPHDPQVAHAYDALARETRAQYDHAVRNGYQFEFYPEHDPYPNSPREAVLDLHHNKHMYVYPTEAGYGSDNSDPQDHPLLGDSGVRWNGKPVTHNDLFRAVHDFYGHAKEGLGFRADGEDNAYRQHAAMFSEPARKALTSETRGQNSWVNFGPHGEHNQTATADTIYAPQKAGLMPDWTMGENRRTSSSEYQWSPGQTAKGVLLHSGEVRQWPASLSTHNEAYPNHLAWFTIGPDGTLVGSPQHEEELRSRLNLPKTREWSGVFGAFNLPANDQAHSYTREGSNMTQPDNLTSWHLAWSDVEPMDYKYKGVSQLPTGHRCRFHPDREAWVNAGMADMCNECYHSWQQATINTNKDMRSVDPSKLAVTELPQNMWPLPRCQRCRGLESLGMASCPECHGTGYQRPDLRAVVPPDRTPWQERLAIPPNDLRQAWALPEGHGIITQPQSLEEYALAQPTRKQVSQCPWCGYIGRFPLGTCPQCGGDVLNARHAHFTPDDAGTPLLKVDGQIHAGRPGETHEEAFETDENGALWRGQAGVVQMDGSIHWYNEPWHGLGVAPDTSSVMDEWNEKFGASSPQASEQVHWSIVVPQVGETVSVAIGPYAGQTGTVEAVSLSGSGVSLRLQDGQVITVNGLHIGPAQSVQTPVRNKPWANTPWQMRHEKWDDRWPKVSDVVEDEDDVVEEIGQHRYDELQFSGWDSETATLPGLDQWEDEGGSTPQARAHTPRSTPYSTLPKPPPPATTQAHARTPMLELAHTLGLDQWEELRNDSQAQDRPSLKEFLTDWNIRESSERPVDLPKVFSNIRPLPVFDPEFAAHVGGQPEPWEPGSDGKAHVYADGTIHAWKTDGFDGTPTHSDMADRLVRSYHVIDPGGSVREIYGPIYQQEHSTPGDAHSVAQAINGYVDPKQGDYFDAFSSRSPNGTDEWDSLDTRTATVPFPTEKPRIVDWSKVDSEPGTEWGHGTKDHPYFWNKETNEIHLGPNDWYHDDLVDLMKKDYGNPYQEGFKGKWGMGRSGMYKSIHAPVFHALEEHGIHLPGNDWDNMFEGEHFGAITPKVFQTDEEGSDQDEYGNHSDDRPFAYDRDTNAIYVGPVGGWHDDLHKQFKIPKHTLDGRWDHVRHTHEFHWKGDDEDHEAVGSALGTVPLANTDWTNRFAKETPGQKVRRWNTLQARFPDQSKVIHTTPQGWTIRHLPTYGDAARTGLLMQNCWKGLATYSDPSREFDPYNTHHRYSLNDEHGMPQVAFFIKHPQHGRDTYEVQEALGARNKPPHPGHEQALMEWAKNNGYHYRQADYNNPLLDMGEDEETDLAGHTFDASWHFANDDPTGAYDGTETMQMGPKTPTGHSLLWEPGWPGKGFYHNGELTTWGVSSTNRNKAWPHHFHMWTQKYPGSKVEDYQQAMGSGSSVFTIEPDGEVHNARLEGEVHPDVFQIDPNLRPAAQESWEDSFA